MSIWKILDEKNGVYSVNDPHKVSDLYFPLTNTQGMLFSSITPNLTGDIKTSVNNFLNYPQTVYDLNNVMSTRSLWLRYNGKAVNISPIYNEESKTTVEAGPMFHKFSTKLKDFSVEVLNFVPEGVPAEVMKFTVTNTSKKEISLEPIFAMPLFARSQDNLRDHRHVTALLSRAYKNDYGMNVCPTMFFDERGHKVNETNYFVQGFKNNSSKPKEIISSLEEFIGEGGSILRPGYVLSKGKKTISDKYSEGKEPLCAMNFGKQTLKAKASTTLYVIMGITEDKPEMIFSKLDTSKKIDDAFEASKIAWGNIYNTFELAGDKNFNFWTKWVNMQPTLRKLFGCSFLPHFDYGRGGRGWRDLWQDLLGLLLFNPTETRQTLINNFKGVRIDGSNATIINNDGGFLADRNKISRVWMDHGVWPYITLRLYVDQTGDYDVLFEQIPYFKDNLLKRARINDQHFAETDNKLRTHIGETYTASVFEHTLIQTIVQFYNVGDHGNTKLEDADWNDGLDMGHVKGESVAFTCMYAHNLRDMADLLKSLKEKKGVDHIELSEEILILLDTLSSEIDYTDIQSKRALLEKYFDYTIRSVCGVKINVSIDQLVADLEKKADAMTKHLREKEWMPKMGIFNGYYDNHGKRVEGKVKNTTRITLTSGVFALMSGVATDKQCDTIYKSFCKHLQEKKFGTFKLNTNFKEVKLDLGRAFAFSYGDKENGAIFAHMDVMFCFSLYKRGLVNEGYDLLKGLFNLASSKEARVYPCISEYYNSDYRGLYNFLTGSASWMTYLVVTEVFGVKHKNGDLTLAPKLTKDQFKKNALTFTVDIDGKRCDIIYKNPDKLDYKDYSIVDAKVNGVICNTNNPKVLTIEKTAKDSLLKKSDNTIEITLA